MDKKTLTRNDISEAIFRDIGLSKQESSQLLESVLSHISEALIENKVVKLSSFGTFSPKNKRARVGRNPKTGIEAAIDARRVISFRPSSLMKEKVNKVCDATFLIFQFMQIWIVLLKMIFQTFIVMILRRIQVMIQ